MTAPVVDSVLDLIGETPLIRIQNLSDEDSAEVWAKCEHLNPGGSVKDRICLAMIEAAEAAGELQPGDTIVEPTSGNTGIGLAVIAKRKGYKLVLTMPASMSLERRALLEAYGAELVLTEPERVMDGALEAAKKVVEERGAKLLQQFENLANPKAHREGTGPEIAEQLGAPVDAFVSAVGTGGTITGAGGYLKERFGTRTIAVEPEASPVLAGGKPGPSKIQGLNAGFIPATYDASVVDEVRPIADQRAWETKLELARREGLLVGISAGANIAVALDVAKELGPGKRVVTLLCDTGERYFSLAEYFA